MFEMFDLKELSSTDNKSKIKDIKSSIAPQLMEMSKSRTRFEIEKMLVGNDGNFIATQFYNLMKQYRTAINEYDNLEIEFEELKRWVLVLMQEIECRQEGGVTHGTHKRYRNFIESEGMNKKLNNVEHVDIEIQKTENSMREIALELRSHLMLINDFEDLRKRLIELNENNEFTSEQYENEQPAYCKWKLASKAMHRLQSGVSGIQEDIIDAYYRACREPVIANSSMKIDPVIDMVPNQSLGEDIPLLNVSKICKDSILSCDPVILKTDQQTNNTQIRKLVP